MPDFSTPMMKQYQQIKLQYPDCLLFYRMGDFYELFLDDAGIGAKVLNITLTSKPVGKGNRIPMAGVPYHAADIYLSRLVKAGYKVAICEQLSPPNKYGLVERAVIRVVTPGTMLDEKALEKKQNNFIVSIIKDGSTLGIAIADISTGYFATMERLIDSLDSSIKEEFAKIKPVECILSETDYSDFELLKTLQSETNLNIFKFQNFSNYSDDASVVLKKHFGVATLAGFALEEKKVAQKAAAALLGYFQETQKSTVSHIQKITLFAADNFLVLDRSTMINLELFSTIREHDTKGTLLNVLDQTITAMGGRLLKDWLSKPLKDKSQIESRYDAIDQLIKKGLQKQDLSEILKQIPDIERILARLSIGLGNPRDLINLKLALENVLEIKHQIQKSQSQLLATISKAIPKELNKLVTAINQTIIEEPPVDPKNGGFIKRGVSPQIDQLHKKITISKDWIKEMEIAEKAKTGITSLKVRFNKVFGFYIEVSKSYVHLVPKDYMRKQTLVNGERFITKELKDQEELILTAEVTMKELEYQLFLKTVETILLKTVLIQDAAASIAQLDCLVGFANLSQKQNYIRPTLLYSGEIKIKNGRHPVVENLLNDNQFVPNDVTLDNLHAQLLLLTGPNMAGKSVYIRQIALIVLMAQIGCYVPAEQALISIVDRIFVRSGASDVITSGLSTFMVEMVETAYILHHATSKSLIIMDEIGRGTSTYDGISIAWAIATYLVTHYKIPPKTLFATHYHELQTLEETFPQHIKNYSMAVTSQDEKPIFLYTVQPGAASHSFGVAVAKLAGIPEEVIQTAQNTLHELENRIGTTGSSEIELPTHTANHPTIDDQTLFEHILFKELDSLDIANLTPLEALNKLAEIKDKIKIISQDSKSFVSD